MLVRVRPSLFAINRLDLGECAEPVANHHLGCLPLAVDADQCGRVLFGGLDAELAVRHTQSAFAHDVLDSSTSATAARVPADKISLFQFVGSGAKFHRAFLCCFDAIGLRITPPFTCITTPGGPCNAARRWITILIRTEALTLLVHLVASEPGRHGDHGVRTELVTAQDLPGPGGGHIGATIAPLFFPCLIALSLLAHALGGHQVDLDPVDLSHLSVREQGWTGQTVAGPAGPDHRSTDH